MEPESPLSKVQRIVEGAPWSSADCLWIANALRLWLREYGCLTLPACMGIANSPSRVKRAMRDGWLRVAAEYVDGGPWERAEALRAAATRFEAGRWRHWKNSAVPPSDASRIEAALHFALRVGAPLPESTQQYRNVLSTQTKQPGNFGVPRESSS